MTRRDEARAWDVPGMVQALRRARRDAVMEGACHLVWSAARQRATWFASDAERVGLVSSRPRPSLGTLSHMGIRSYIERSKPVVLDLLDRAILREGFANYDKVAAEFKRFGKGFTKSSIHRYAVKLEERRQRARFEAEVIEALGDEIGWLVKWARSYPSEASRLVRRLKSKEKGPAHRP